MLVLVHGPGSFPNILQIVGNFFNCFLISFESIYLHLDAIHDFDYWSSSNVTERYAFALKHQLVSTNISTDYDGIIEQYFQNCR